MNEMILATPIAAFPQPGLPDFPVPHGVPGAATGLVPQLARMVAAPLEGWRGVDRKRRDEIASVVDAAVLGAAWEAHEYRHSLSPVAFGKTDRAADVIDAMMDLCGYRDSMMAQLYVLACLAQPARLMAATPAIGPEIEAASALVFVRMARKFGLLDLN
jgi:hypothetical protein